jgi:hypothetical protein
MQIGDFKKPRLGGNGTLKAFFSYKTGFCTEWFTGSMVPTKCSLDGLLAWYIWL